ncbi:class I ribonucleotide reductase maintenance protein YfaE [Marinomonas mediterranea]|jgi:Ferredoxin|uniref:Ferredoxin n=1 Tax=Marinomonas mediterranea (strain ATCC 700492 / JCM 21426 / NBRC 103028 / MMB-1) TaxID=717774 RepID=F2K2F1_MARM1|nr:class I ribonucleotide reductase maintenance protein YfaE [Marinomonas mediterranea]ADZ92331.1 ferredoxin [Marinomonas mediterranea MMB-1]WCN10283.1 2Fe-2S iron-sulfur cluster binding domain-containing protein [Marinomonas mediterranea]WCN14329.1 2Fe-2S iron-sulfur cluster binding domain-containing protein [Marinomonas mediterranea]WCN18381.1 2Fe-2S iron-sulfur cluster binding domain-containing protein [Marinomonas mediterranea MMB-1]
MQNSTTLTSNHASKDTVHRVLLGKKQFLVTEDEPLLPQLERAGLHIEYQCREGYCSSCSIRLLWGQIEYPFEPLAWVQSGFLLACCAIVKSDIEIAFFND